MTMGLPPDIYPESGARLPPVKREELDEQGRREFDALVAHTGGASLAGLRGPGGLNLHSPAAAGHLNALSRYLRYESGLTPRVRETAILAVAREMDQPFEWAAHEANALTEGVPQATVDTIRQRRPLAGLDDTDAVVIELARQALGGHKVDSSLFARARRIFGDRALVELTLLVGSYASIAVLLTTFDVQLPPGRRNTLPPRE